MSSLDTSNLIACQPCAKAKAKCDKQLPTCSRCLYKRIKCEQRAPRRYPDNFRSLPSHLPTASPPRSTANPVGGQDSDAGFTVGNFRWQPNAFPDSDQCPGDLGVTQVQPALPQVDTSMDYDFSAANFDIPFSPSSLMNNIMPRGAPANGDLFSPDVNDPVPSESQSTPSLPTRSSSSGLPNEHLPCFQCNPKYDQRINPRIGSEFLRKLEETLNNQSAWTASEFPITDTNLPSHHIIPVQGSLRDKLMVVSQGFLSRARSVHRTGDDEALLGRASSSSNGSLTGFFLLPPPAVLEDFLKIYANRVEPYMPFFSASRIDLAALVSSSDEESTIIMLLLMIAHGAMGNALPEARYIASGLVEICRISMFDALEKNVQMAAQLTMLRCALLYINGAAWSGYKWHMDLSAAHSRMYISMVRHAGLLDERPSPFDGLESATNAEQAWDIWKSRESLNRLAFSWLILDQELSIFHDSRPDIEVDDCNAPMPCNDDLWNAPSADSWQAAVPAFNLTDPKSPWNSRSLSTLFTMFTCNDLSMQKGILPCELRLLLHPLQTLVYHLNKSLHYSFSPNDPRGLQRLLIQIEDVQFLLQRWHTFYSEVSSVKNPSPVDRTNLVVFHLISLNASIYLPDIEKLARGDMSLDIFKGNLWTGKRCVEEAAQVWVHCGQILRHARQMPASHRPFWWAGAIYRIALSMWAISLCNRTTAQRENTLEHGHEIAIDGLAFDHPSVTRYFHHQDGVPTLSEIDNVAVDLTSPLDIIRHCIAVLTKTLPLSQLDGGVISRLSSMAERWQNNSPSA